ncbi:MAG: single-stranded DNA-binding protein [Synergistaceae bacterium]|nr:single-stranded DNA-binding protein [Synergistaceae bacterium]
MRGLNRAVIAGNLTRDPEIRQTVNKRSIARFAVAINRSYKDSNGEYKDATEYVNVVVWGPFAEHCGKYLKKGSPVLVEGRIQTTSFDAKDGSGKRYMTEINAENVIFLNQGQGQQGNNNIPSSQPWPEESDPNFGSSINETGFGGGFPDNNETAAHESDIPF